MCQPIGLQVYGMNMHTYDDISAKFYASVALFMYASAFQGLITLHKKLHNPFLASMLHVGHEPIVNGGLRQLADRLMEGTEFLPPGAAAQLAILEAAPPRSASGSRV